MMTMMTKNLGICVTCEVVFIPVTCNKVQISVRASELGWCVLGKTIAGRNGQFTQFQQVFCKINVDIL